ncbi:MAG: molybdenum cofactor guanylyltransferase [Sphingomonas sp.]|uniref:molybdenum cofactor guanylyltransferase n=1 Tax=Sphingomonas sp. TaxID=28214 RepID=UPI001AC6AEAA|nr:molybdenum cofactor guanylyltransferase [Sphingomonas sp.]MBN8809247.1 molybdenum cofactor guanylyltransferase [Sphingomonas sp.]
MRTLGAVLAGGRSSRFGSDKALAGWRGRPLIDHVIDTLAATVDAVVICGRSYRDLPALADRPAPDLGPLAAINAALHCAGNAGFDRILTVPCDVPTIDRALLDVLLMRDDAAFLADMPVVGIWPATLAAALDAHLATDGTRSIRGWAAAIGATPIALVAAQLPPNINRPDDLAKLTD